MVYNLALQYTQNIEDSEEITQDVFLKIHEKRKSFREEASIKTWIYRLTINQSLDYIKAKKTKKRSQFFSKNNVTPDQVQIADSPFNHPGIQLEHQESLKQLLKLINELPHNQKTAIILQKVDGLTMDETCEVMNITYKALESLLQRAKKNLATLIETNEGL
jgi:RNA polymerase sigma-70 factor (ECF subfamily)